MDPISAIGASLGITKNALEVFRQFQSLAQNLDKSCPLQIDTRIVMDGEVDGGVVRPGVWLPSAGAACPPENDLEWPTWAASSGFPLTGYIVLRLLLRSKSSRKAAIGRPKLRTLPFEPEVQGIELAPLGKGGRDLMPKTELFIDLDARRIDFPRDFSGRLWNIGNDTVELEVIAQASRGSYFWALDFEASWGGKWHTFTLQDAAGMPFMLVGNQSLPRYNYYLTHDGHGDWVQSPRGGDDCSMSPLRRFVGQADRLGRLPGSALAQRGSVWMRKHQ